MYKSGPIGYYKLNPTKQYYWDKEPISRSSELQTIMTYIHAFFLT